MIPEHKQAFNSTDSLTSSISDPKIVANEKIKTSPSPLVITSNNLSK